MEIVQREKLIIYLKNMKHERQIRKYGHIVSTNKTHKYVAMYVEQQQIDQIVQNLMKLKYVTKVVGSPYKTIKKVYEKEKYEF
ncbi:YlbG family protein [Staphylococcus ratti]|uniref:YlbG family protein n=1 Tax=Staphylococcus ratti TaxID=2892440 RepID=A0ABY3PAW7_9STAP|nr:YlbG family protein [Staphylococcus ratti]UEX89439.1 YlbG family protein [Staphylococcus ratti]